MAQAAQEAAVAAGDWAALVEEGQGGDKETRLGEILEEVHEVAANLILLLALLHVAGVVVESRVMGSNLLRPMLIARRKSK